MNAREPRPENVWTAKDSDVLMDLFRLVRARGDLLPTKESRRFNELCSKLRRCIALDNPFDKNASHT